MNCLLCQSDSLISSPRSLGPHDEDFQCPVCGHYQMSFELQVDRDITKDNRPLLAALSAATKQANAVGKILRLTLENYFPTAEAHRWTPVSRKFMKVLEVCQKRSSHFGARFALDFRVDYPLLDAITPEEGWALICHVREEQLISAPSC